MSVKIELPKPVIVLVEKLYPTLDLQKVSFYTGLPWFLFAQPWVSGITLPHNFRPGHIAIYFREIDFERLEGVSLVVHECYHALQYQQCGSPSGPGFFNRFLAQYFASWTRHGYRNHPLEVPAYTFEAAFQTYAEEFMLAEWTAETRESLLLTDRYPTCHSTNMEYRDESWRLLLTWPLLVVVAVLKFVLDAGLAVLPAKAQ